MVHDTVTAVAMLAEHGGHGVEEDAMIVAENQAGHGESPVGSLPLRLRVAGSRMLHPGSARPRRLHRQDAAAGIEERCDHGKAEGSATGWAAAESGTIVGHVDGRPCVVVEPDLHPAPGPGGTGSVLDHIGEHSPQKRGFASRTTSGPGTSTTDTPCLTRASRTAWLTSGLRSRRC